MHGPRRHGNAHEFGHHEAKVPWWKQAHRDWRVWTGVILITVAMVAYVLSVSESIGPGGGTKAQQQAAP